MDGASMKITWHQQAFRDLLQDPAIQRELDRRGQMIADAAGEGFEVRSPTLAPRRDRVAIITATRHAERKNAKHMTLVKALGAAHGR